MSSPRKTIFADGEIYHVYNRGIEGAPVFTTTKEYKRAIITLFYYSFSKPSLRLSEALKLADSLRQEFFDKLKELQRRVEIISYCLMPNHFHFLLKQLEKGGVQKFVGDFTNSYTRYFNLRHNARVGPIFQGPFKAVHIDTNEQLLHTSRYIHINPAVSFLVEKEELEDYPWSSLPEYLGETVEEICSKDIILNQFKSVDDYRKFVFEQIDYGRELEKMKHLEG
jgi:putative transposase